MQRRYGYTPTPSADDDAPAAEAALQPERPDATGEPTASAAHDATRAPQPGALRVVLAAPHTHAGRAYAKGDTLEVSADARDWMQARGIIED